MELEEPELKKLFKEKVGSKEGGSAVLHQHITDLFAQRGLLLHQFSETVIGHEASLTNKDFHYNHDTQILESLVLIEHRRFFYFSGYSELNLVFYQITNLGLKLLQLCSPVAETLLSTKRPTAPGKPTAA